MFARPFYEIPVDRYFFGRNDSPEEKVRQWVISELLSFYGFTITNIQIEVPVKIGTRKDLRADIVIYKDSFPYIVIECKKQDTNKKGLEDGLIQAISYADSSLLKASFVICTNGENHLVKRKFSNGWEFISEIDRLTIHKPHIALGAFLEFIVDLKPLFYWLYKPIPYKYAQDFFSHIHSLLYDLSCPPKLLTGFDHLLRVLGNDLTLTTDYGMSKMKIAFEVFLEYFKDIGIRSRSIYSEGLFNYELVNILLTSFRDISSNTKGMSNLEAKWVRLIFILLQYLSLTVSSKQIQDVPIEVMQGFQSILEVVCEEKLNVELPDILDKEALKEIQYFSNYLNDNPHPSF